MFNPICHWPCVTPYIFIHITFNSLQSLPLPLTFPKALFHIFLVKDLIKGSFWAELRHKFDKTGLNLNVEIRS